MKPANICYKDIPAGILTEKDSGYIGAVSVKHVDMKGNDNE